MTHFILDVTAIIIGVLIAELIYDYIKEYLDR